MRTLYLSILLLQSILTHGQSREQLELKDYPIKRIYWPDKKISLQKQYWDNGKVQIEYEQLQDSTRLRKEYFESGNLKLTAQVYQKYGRLTQYTEDIETGELVMTVDSGYIDVLQGEYKEYWDAIGVAATTTGTFLNDKQFGEWDGKTIR